MPVLETVQTDHTQSTWPIPGREFLDTTSARDLAAAVRSLSGHPRLVLELLYFEQLTLSEVTLVLDMVPSEVLQAHAHAMAQLRDRLQSTCM
jgi:RNA polymerase sigma factor FliA